MRFLATAMAPVKLIATLLAFRKRWYLQMYELFLKTGNVPFAFRFFVFRVFGGRLWGSDRVSYI